jgi:hypothetical protein
MLRFVVVAAVFSGLFGTPYSRPEVRRRDFFVDSDPRHPPFREEVVDGSASGQAVGKPILLLHGARVPGMASFDLPVRGGSFAADLVLRYLLKQLVDRGFCGFY